MNAFWNWLNGIKLPRGTDLAIWWLGWICVVALYLKVDGAKEISLALGGGMVGYLTGRATAKNGDAVQADLSFESGVPQIKGGKP